MDHAKQIENDAILDESGTRLFNTVSGEVRVIIPKCCREGWDSCPHVAQKRRAVRRNIGL